MLVKITNVPNQEEKNLKAVHERDLQNLLEKVGLKEDFETNLVQCNFCGKIVNHKNLYSLFKESGAIKMVCDNPNCVATFLLHIEQAKGTKDDNAT